MPSIMLRAPAVDTLRMGGPESSAEVGVGAPVVVVRVANNPPQQHRGSVANVRTNALAIRLGGDAAFTPGEPILVIAATSPRMAVHARFAASQDDLHAFQLDGAWRSLDVRRDSRYSVDLVVEVRSVLGKSRQPGTVVNISPGGVAVAVPARPGGRQVELALGVTGYSATLPCELVGVTETEGAVVLHLRFAELSPAQQAFLRHVIGIARASAEGESRELAS